MSPTIDAAPGSYTGPTARVCQGLGSVSAAPTCTWIVSTASAPSESVTTAVTSWVPGSSKTWTRFRPVPSSMSPSDQVTVSSSFSGSTTVALRFASYGAGPVAAPDASISIVGARFSYRAVKPRGSVPATKLRDREVSPSLQPTNVRRLWIGATDNV